MAQSKIISIGVLAHVDAGKTTLTEALLFAAGATKLRGSVDKGSAITDGLAMEKNRGISIKTSTVDLEWKDHRIYLVDTPGHVDFSAEVDRALSVLDVVILVVSAKEGVQAHTMSLWASLKERNLKVIVFVNKIDRSGVDLEAVYSDFQRDMNTRLFALNFADVSIPEEPSLVDFVDTQSFRKRKIIDNSLENLAEVDESFLEEYIEDQVGDLDVVLDKAWTHIESQMLVPVIFGSAKLDIGLELILNAIVKMNSSNNEFVELPSAKVFKVEFDQKYGRLAYVRSFGGTIKSKDVIFSQHLNDQIKVNQIFQKKLGKVEQVNELHRGEIGVITTSDVILSGDVLGEEKYRDSFEPIGQSVLSVEAIAKEQKDYQKLGEALQILDMEDPKLEFQWFKEEKEFHLKILGPIQTEVLKDSLLQRFNIDAEFMSPKVIYKETPSKTAEGYVRYWMPKPCWAIMTFLIEPAALGSGLTFVSNVGTNDISNKYQNEVKRAIPWSLRQGIKGWEVTDLKITLIEGSEHNVHSNPGDFLLATPMGVLRGIENAGTNLLEPMYAFQIKAHQDYLGAVSSDLNQMKAQIDAPEFEGEYFTLTGRVSVEKSMNYSIQFNASTSGKGRLKMTLDGYEPTQPSDQKTREFKGVSPLDESQWILHKRGAFKADER